MNSYVNSFSGMLLFISIILFKRHVVLLRILFFHPLHLADKFPYSCFYFTILSNFQFIKLTIRLNCLASSNSLAASNCFLMGRTVSYDLLTNNKHVLIHLFLVQKIVSFNLLDNSLSTISDLLTF